ncbi:MAG: hypothetical protein R3Y24_09425 [Eubacteriales bacterium]
MREAMSVWLMNLESYLKNKKIEKCPICGSSEVDVQELDIGRGSITFSCKECESFVHFDKSSKDY